MRLILGVSILCHIMCRHASPFAFSVMFFALDCFFSLLFCKVAPPANLTQANRRTSWCEFEQLASEVNKLLLVQFQSSSAQQQLLGRSPLPHSPCKPLNPSFNSHQSNVCCNCAASLVNVEPHILLPYIYSDVR